MPGICQLGDSQRNKPGQRGSRLLEAKQEMLEVEKGVMAIPTDAGRVPSHLPDSFSHRGENKPQPLVTSRRVGSLVDVH